MVKITGYVYVTKDGSIRLTKGRGGIRADEVAIRLDIDVPRRFFERPLPVVAIDLTHADLHDDVDAIIDTTAEIVAGKLRVAVGDVRDGLAEAMTKANAS